MSTKLNPEKIAQLLTYSSRQLDKQTLSALSQARQNALHRQSAHSPVFALNTGHWSHHLVPHSAQQWLAIGLLAAILACTASFWHHADEQQIGELDVAILTDELPIEVFVD